VDYGEKILVKLRDIRQLEPVFCRLPKQAIPCCLDDFPQDSINEQFAAECLRSIMKDTKYDFRLVHQQTEMKVPLPVYIFCELNGEGREESEMEGRFIHDMIMEQQKPVDPITSSSPSGGPQWDPMKADFEMPSNRTTALQQKVQLDSEIIGADEIPSIRICKFYRFNGKCAAGNDCEYKHIRTGDAFRTSDEKLVNVVMGRSLDPPKVGSKVTVQLTCIRHPEQFFVVLPHGALDWTNPQEVLSHKSKERIDVTTHLGKLQQVMTNYYQDSNHQSATVRQLEVVAARYDQDGRCPR